MDAFETIVAQYLELEGYWVRQDIKVEISKEDKKQIGLPTMPRPQIDIVALNIRANELLLVEVKSFLDSYGVWFEAISGEDDKAGKRYRLFTDSTYRRIVTERLKSHYLEQGLINDETRINCALAAGNIHSTEDEIKISKYFTRKGWKLFSPITIKRRMKELSKRGWEDNIITVTAKLLLRD